MRSAIFQTVLGRLSALLLGLALFAGGFWSWETAPWYLVPQRYYVTVSPDLTSMARAGRPFDIGSSFHRSLLVSGPFSMPFGADPDVNTLLMERGADPASPIQAINAKDYSRDCGFIEDKTQSERAVWRGARLCNGGNLTGEVLQAALVEFHEKTDAEIANYSVAIVRNAATKIGIALSIALAALLVVTAMMWVMAGRLL
ncbi:hypothetical protein [Bradyrhizobium zhanjiangense]|uniref:Uncharacterized protein n=1 Tax=Bradyrhizobium zhanjiangense TaxID=1325107 RepID=A0ABY0D9Z8_9BRAD|nr:hypothetical protein [Bradyrhizobium zhanjiangense]RXG87357.1 hypothetical protein EAS62_36060 [Bradyrhizobium zhanjiangense]